MGWNDGLSSSLGTTGGSGGNSWSRPLSFPSRDTEQPGSGDTGFFGSLTNPLGLVSGLRSLGSGIVHAVGAPVANVFGAIGNATQGEWGEAAASLGKAGQNIGDLGASLATSGENLATTALLPFGGPGGLSNVVNEDVFQPFNKWLADADANGNYNAFISPEMGKALYAGGKGMKATDWWTGAQERGAGAATVQTAAELAMFLGPFKEASAAIAGDAAEAASIAARRGATADAAAYAARAERLQQIDRIVGVGAHPLKTVGRSAADLLGEMRTQAFPAETPGTPVAPEAPAVPEETAAQEAEVPHELVVAARDSMHPAQAAAEGMAAADAQGYAVHPALAEALAAATREAETATQAVTSAPVPEGHVRLYNAGPGDQTMWTASKSRAESYAEGGPVRQLDVPQAEADALKTTEGSEAHRQATEAGHQPNTASDYYLGERSDLIGNAVEGARTELPKVEPQIEPRSYKPGKGQITTPEERVAMDEQLRTETAAAREAVQPPLYVIDQLGNRLNMPAPMWAQRIAESLPDSVNQLLGRIGANYVDKVRFANVERNLMQAMETAQAHARTSPAMKLAESAARDILSSKLDRATASHMIGEEIHARLNGEALVGEWAKAHGGFQPTEDQMARLQRAARGDYGGIPESVWKTLNPGERLQLQDALNTTVEGFKGESARTLQTLMASRYGAKGLESALLSPDDVMMTPQQLRLYRRSERDLLYAAKARERVPKELERREAEAARAEAVGLRAHGVVDQLRVKLGTTLQTVQDLYKGIPKGLADDGASLIQQTLRTVANEGGALIDVAEGKPVVPTSGIYVPLVQQFDIPLADWATQGPQVLHEALFQPKGPGVSVYDPQALYGGPDARLAVNIVTGADGQGRVVGNIAMSTINGNPMRPWQAHILGGAHEQLSGYDFATGKSQPFVDNATEQALLMHYVGQMLDSKSGLSRWANQRSDVIENPAVKISPRMLNDEATAMLRLDHEMTRRNAGWKRGDIFNTELAFGKSPPTLGHLAQTIMDDLSVPEHVDKAMVHAEVESVNKMLQWYYDSHNFVEDLYRGKTVPLTGRDAAETFYDVLALSSVMASPTQNLGRTLAGFANLDDFVKAHDAALTDAKAVMEQVMGNKPNDVVYVRNLGVRPEDVERLPGEKDAVYKRRQIRDSEREVRKGEGGTPVSQRWFDSPAARELSHQTSMTTGPKYRIIDALLGRFNLERATAEDIGGQPEWWTGRSQDFSDANLSPQAVVHHANLLGLDGPEVQAYKDWAQAHTELEAARDVRNEPGYVKPITDSENVEAKASPTAGELGDNREVSAQEYQNLAADGRAYVEEALANSSPHVLADDALRAELFRSVQEEWGGATVDAHTGKAIPADYVGDTYAVTARLKGMKPSAIPIGASEAAFNRAYDRALVQYKAVLDSEGGHLGVFNNPTTGRIEIDPVYNTQTPQETEAVGAYTHAVGGAYHFRSGNGYWIPHVKDAEAFASKADATRAVKESSVRGRTLAKTGDLRQAYENALMEYHGSALLAKLRSFRDNLAHPHTSLAVTLDSIMAQLFGFEKTHWGMKGEYAKYADMIRESATQWSTIAERPVMPHEVQALLWVYAKRFIGQQDWGRLQAHLKNAHDVLTYLEDQVSQGKTLNVKNFDPLQNWWKEELQFSRDQLAVRTERKALRMKRTAGTITADEAERLDYLEKVPTRQETQTQVMGEDGVVDYQRRNETSYDAKVLSHKEMQYTDYKQKVLGPMRKAIDEGDYETARSLIDEYVLARRKAIMGSTEGGAFGPKMVEDPNSVGYQSIARLLKAEHVPAPNTDALNMSELYDSYGGKVRGATIEHPNKLGRIMMRLYANADVSTLLHEDLHAFRLMAPGDEVAVLSEVYPHIQDATLTPARVAAEEQFVHDFMRYLSDRASYTDTRLSPAMRARIGAKYTGPMADLFNNVSDLMEQHYGPSFRTEAGSAVPNAMVDYWDSIFHGDIQKPERMADPLQPGYVPGRGVNPEQLRAESPFSFTQRVRQYGEARGQAEVLAQRVRDAEARAVKADKFANDMRSLVMEPTQSDIIARRLEDRANRSFAKISEQLGHPTGNDVPKVWRPLVDAIDRIREEAKEDPSMAPILEELPEHFEQVLRFAAELGFEPTHMPEITWQMAQRYLYGHLQLGRAEESGLRRENMGVLNRAKVVDRSLESLGAGSVMAMRELLTSKLVQFVEEHYAREYTPGKAIPPGWHAWDETRDAVITGRNLEKQTVAINATKIIPDAVYQSLRHFQKPPLDLPFRFLWKGGPTAVWKNLILSFSPTWYIKNFIGNVAFSTAEGVTLRDWATAWKQYKSGTLPDVARGRDIHHAIDLELGTAGSVISRNKLADLPDLVRAEGMRMAAHEVVGKMKAVDGVVDSMTRAAIYAKHVRTSGDVSLAAYRAFEATGDFGRLGPIERSMVAQLIPFYAFQKAMFRLLARMPVDHPAATALSMQLGQMHEAYLKERLGGSLPTAFYGSEFLGAGKGHLTNLDYIVPWAGGWQLATPEGIAQSAHPFARLLAQQAMHSSGYGSNAGMDERGNLIPAPNLGESILNTYSGAIPFMGKPGERLYNLGSGLSQKQYDKLIHRILRTQQAQQRQDNGGYVVTDVWEPAKPKPIKLG